MGLKSKKWQKEVCRTVEFSYLLYLPPGAEQGTKKWPLVIFLHGVGERGNNLELVKRHGPPKLIEEGQKFPFILVAPQCPADRWWNVEDLDAWLLGLLKELPVDANRVYLTGLSMGGFGTFEWATKHPERFAAIAPICGGGEPFLASRLKNVPAWIFHGAKDPVVPLKRSQEMVEAIKKAGGIVKFTVYPEAGHDSWTATYANPQLYQWLLAQRKSR